MQLHLMPTLSFSICIRKKVGGLKLYDLPGLEALQIPGVMLGSIFIILQLTILVLDDDGLIAGWTSISVEY